MKFVRWLLAVFLCAQAPLVFSADGGSYPSKLITIIVPFAPGSGTDISARQLADAMTKRTGKPVVVDNRPGASGQIAARAAAAAPPDGYTMLLTTNTTHGANSAMFKRLNYDPIRDFAPVSTVSSSGMVLVVRTESPHKTAQSLFNAMRAGNKVWHYGIGNASSQVEGALLGARLNAKAMGVSYRGTMPAVNDMMGGILDYMFVDVGAVLGLIHSGRLRPLATTGPERELLLREVPTLDEIGLKDMQMTAWSAAFLPAKTPKPIVNKLSELVREIMNDPTMRQTISQLGGRSRGSTPEALQAFVASEIDKWGKAVKAAGIQPE